MGIQESAGVQHTAQPVRAAFDVHAVAGAASTRGHTVCGTQHFLRDDLDETFDVEGCVGHGGVDW